MEASMASKFVTQDGQTVWLRPAIKDDAEAMIRGMNSVAREGKYFLRSHFERDVETERAFIARTREQGDLILVAVVEGRLVGWVTLFRGRPEFLRHTASLGMAVIKSFRGLGIGSALLDSGLLWAAEHGIEKVNLGVRASNVRARTLYSRFGFVEEGVRAREIRDQHGRYDDNVEMAYFVPADSAPLGGSTG
jgi:ribosomal protein S18 acetylase RimI-like enzyme